MARMVCSVVDRRHCAKAARRVGLRSTIARRPSCSYVSLFRTDDRLLRRLTTTKKSSNGARSCTGQRAIGNGRRRIDRARVRVDVPGSRMNCYIYLFLYIYIYYLLVCRRRLQRIVALWRHDSRHRYAWYFVCLCLCSSVRGVRCLILIRARARSKATAGGDITVHYVTRIDAGTFSSRRTLLSAATILNVESFPFRVLVVTEKAMTAFAAADA